jgi:hypothetical protein
MHCHCWLCCCCHRRHLPPPPPILAVFLLNVLGKALASLHHHEIAEQKMLLQSVCFVRACAAHVGCLLLASATEAPSLSVSFPPSYLFEAKCLLNHRCLDGGNGSGRLIHDGSLHCTNTLLILDEFVSKPSKEFKAAHCSVVGVDHLLEK